MSATAATCRPQAGQPTRDAAVADTRSINHLQPVRTNGGRDRSKGLGLLILRLVIGYWAGRYVSVSSSNSQRTPSMSTAVKSSEGSSAVARPLSIMSRI